MQDEVNTKVVAIMIKGGKISAEVLKKALTYFGVIGIFAVGAGLGSVLTARFAEKGIWVSCLLLAVSFLMMFVREEEKK